jgi:hypothetical protein
MGYAHLLKLLVLMLRTRKKFDRALTVIAFLHRNFAKRTHTDRWLYAASNGAPGDSVALPVMAGNVTSMLMTHVAAPVALIVDVFPTLTLTVLFPFVRPPEDDIDDCCAVPMTLHASPIVCTQLRCIHRTLYFNHGSSASAWLMFAVF